MSERLVGWVGLMDGREALNSLLASRPESGTADSEVEVCDKYVGEADAIVGFRRRSAGRVVLLGKSARRWRRGGR